MHLQTFVISFMKFYQLNFILNMTSSKTNVKIFLNNQDSHINKKGSIFINANDNRNVQSKY